MCTGRVDLAHVLRAFSNGADGVFIGGCHIGDCHYITHGNYNALSMVAICKKLMEHIGLNPERLRFEHVSAGEGIRFAEIMNEYNKQIKNLGPLGKSEGIDENTLREKLDAVSGMVPYIKLVERERMRVPVKTEEAYSTFFNSDEFSRLFNETIVDKLADKQIISLLHEGPMTNREIAKVLNLTPSEVSRHLNGSIRQGLVKYEESERRFALA